MVLTADTWWTNRGTGQVIFSFTDLQQAGVSVTKLNKKRFISFFPIWKKHLCVSVWLYYILNNIAFSTLHMWLTLGQFGSLALSIIRPSPIRSLKKIQKQIKDTGNYIFTNILTTLVSLLSSVEESCKATERLWGKKESCRLTLGCFPIFRCHRNCGSSPF